MTKDQLQDAFKIRRANDPTTGVSIEFMNVFNTVNENAVLNPGTGATIFQVTSGYRDTPEESATSGIGSRDRLRVPVESRVG